MDQFLGGQASFIFVMKWHLVDYLPVLKVFRPGRFFYLNPLLWHFIFALSLNLIIQHSQKGEILATVFLGLQLLFTFFYHDEIQNLKKNTTYRQLYSQDMFAEIRDYIGRDQNIYRVVSIGMHPAIASYNNFHTLDGYLGSYPLKHKHAFRKVIENELGKSETTKKYFDFGGGRCYVFSSELTFSDWLYTKSRTTPISNLSLNSEQLLKMGGEYIFSAVEIKNYAENGLEFLKIFEKESSGWRIFLYVLKTPAPTIKLDQQPKPS